MVAFEFLILQVASCPSKWRHWLQIDVHNAHSVSGSLQQLAIKTSDSVIHNADLVGPKARGTSYETEFGISACDVPFPSCLTKDMITGVYLRAPPGATDGWAVQSFSSFAEYDNGYVEKLTSDPALGGLWPAEQLHLWCQDGPTLCSRLHRNHPPKWMMIRYVNSGFIFSS